MLPTTVCCCAARLQRAPSATVLSRWSRRSSASSSAVPEQSSSRMVLISSPSCLHGVHCPQDSTARNRETPAATATGSAAESTAMKLADPRPVPSAANASWLTGVSNWSGVRIAFDTPSSTKPGEPGVSAIVSSAGGCAIASTSPSGVPAGTSYTPGRATAPVTVQSRVPGVFAVPTERNQLAPLAMIIATLANVSTLLTSTGGTTLSSLSVASSTLADSALPASTSSIWSTSSTTSTSPRRHGGAMRGNGGRPSITSSRAVSSPYRYSRGPSTTTNSNPGFQEACDTSAIASRSRAICGNVCLVAIVIVCALATCAAIIAPSSTAYGLRSSSRRSLNVPGSPSAALTTTVVGRTSDANDRMVRHFVPVGNPAPPRPRRPDASSSASTTSRSTAIAPKRPAPPSIASY